MLGNSNGSPSFFDMKDVTKTSRIYSIPILDFPWPSCQRVVDALHVLSKEAGSSQIPDFTTRDSVIWVFSRFGASTTIERTAPFFLKMCAYFKQIHICCMVHNEGLVVGSDTLNPESTTSPWRLFLQGRNCYLGYATSRIITTFFQPWTSSTINTSSTIIPINHQSGWHKIGDNQVTENIPKMPAISLIVLSDVLSPSFFEAVKDLRTPLVRPYY